MQSINLACISSPCVPWNHFEAMQTNDASAKNGVFAFWLRLDLYAQGNGINITVQERRIPEKRVWINTLSEGGLSISNIMFIVCKTSMSCEEERKVLLNRDLSDFWLLLLSSSCIWSTTFMFLSHIQSDIMEFFSLPSNLYCDMSHFWNLNLDICGIVSEQIHGLFVRKPCQSLCIKKQIWIVKHFNSQRSHWE